MSLDAFKRSSVVPLLILVGQQAKTTEHAHALVQSRVCGAGADRALAAYTQCLCSACMRVKQHAHYQLWWLEPERGYTVEDIEQVMQRTRLALDPGQFCTVVFAQADALGSIVSNRLLKLFEEPPAGYQFILLTSDLQSIMPTVRSRACVVVLDIAADSQPQLIPLAASFLQCSALDPVQFEALVKSAHLSEQQSLQIASQLLAQLTSRVRNAHATQESDVMQAWYQAAADTVAHALRMPPAAGGSEFFWKLLYLEFPWQE